MSLSKNIVLASFLMFGFLWIGAIKAQTVSFIHIQSENNNAFSVQWKGNIYPSSKTGYLVIPQVMAGEQVLVFDFQDKSLPAYTFTLTMDDKPRGFTLKQSINNSWSLFDMVNFAVTKGTEMPKQKFEKPVFVVNKPAEPEKKPAPELIDTVAKNLALPQTIVNAEKLAAGKTAKSTEPPIQKIFDKAHTAGIDQVYVVISKGKADTIAIFIPALKDEAAKQSAFTIGKEWEKANVSGSMIAWVYPDRLKKAIK